MVATRVAQVGLGLQSRCLADLWHRVRRNAGGLDEWGEASAITTPAWLALGVPLPAAVATDKLAGAVWTLFGARNYLRRRIVDLVEEMAGGEETT